MFPNRTGDRAGYAALTEIPVGTPAFGPSCTHRGTARLAFLMALTFSWSGCENIPSGVSVAPKLIEADGSLYTACEGYITVYHPSRDIADSSSQTYEITFTDDYGKARDLKDVKAYTIRKTEPNLPLNYATPAGANPSDTTTKESNGQPLMVGHTYWFGKDGDEGRVKWAGPGKWEPVPCKSPLDGR